MKFTFNASGANTPVIKEFDIATSTAINEGAAVGIKNGLVVAATGATYILGVAAETHKGSADLLNPRANGTKIRVNISPCAIYNVPAQKLTATGGSATTFVCDGTNLSTSLSAGKLVLVSKGASSTNTDKLGTVRTISACSITTGTATITVSSGGTAAAGDVYALLFAPGTEVYLDSTGKNAVMYNSGTTVKLIAATSDTDTLECGMKLKAQYLA